MHLSNDCIKQEWQKIRYRVQHSVTRFHSCKDVYRLILNNRRRISSCLLHWVHGHPWIHSWIINLDAWNHCIAIITTQSIPTTQIYLVNLTLEKDIAIQNYESTCRRKSEVTMYNVKQNVLTFIGQPSWAIKKY